MKVIINKDSFELTEGATVSDALSAAGIGTNGIAVAVNETVVPKKEYSSFKLSDGNELLIIRAFYGG